MLRTVAVSSLRLINFSGVGSTLLAHVDEIGPEISSEQLKSHSNQFPVHQWVTDTFSDVYEAIRMVLSNNLDLDGFGRLWGSMKDCSEVRWRFFLRGLR